MGGIPCHTLRGVNVADRGQLHDVHRGGPDIQDNRCNQRDQLYEYRIQQHQRLRLHFKDHQRGFQVRVRRACVRRGLQQPACPGVGGNEHSGQDHQHLDRRDLCGGE